VIRQQHRAALLMMVVGLLRFWSLVQYGPRQRYWLAMCSHDQEKGDMPRVSGAAVSLLQVITTDARGVARFPPCASARR
jgi:hypothetical protein